MTKHKSNDTLIHHRLDLRSNKTLVVNIFNPILIIFREDNCWSDIMDCRRGRRSNQTPLPMRADERIMVVEIIQCYTIIDSRCTKETF